MMVKGESKARRSEPGSKAPERRTRQRDGIAAVFEREGRPLSPREVHRLVKEELPGLGLATVYRAVNRLVEEGRLIELDIPGLGACYETAVHRSHHAHFLCRTCKRVFEVEGAVKDVGPDVPAGFALEDFELILKGKCAECGDN